RSRPLLPSLPGPDEDAPILRLHPRRPDDRRLHSLRLFEDQTSAARLALGRIALLRVVPIAHADRQHHRLAIVRALGDQLVRRGQGSSDRSSRVVGAVLALYEFGEVAGVYSRSYIVARCGIIKLDVRGRVQKLLREDCQTLLTG